MKTWGRGGDRESHQKLLGGITSMKWHSKGGLAKFYPLDLKIYAGSVVWSSCGVYACLEFMLGSRVWSSCSWLQATYHLILDKHEELVPGLCCFLGPAGFEEFLKSKHQSSLYWLETKTQVYFYLCFEMVRGLPIKPTSNVWGTPRFANQTFQSG